MPPQEAGTQAVRISKLFTDTYGWPQELVSRELITAVEHHFERPGEPVTVRSAHFLAKKGCSTPNRHERSAG